MKFEIKTVTILMCAALALALSACSKKTITPAEDPQPAEVGFTASSQAVWVKGGETPTTSFPYDNFGVWGIARHQHVESPYILWSTNQLTEVSAPEGTSTNQETSNVVFTPATAAYWLGGYEYSFLAVAPYNAAGLYNVNFTLANTSGNTTGKDYMTFTYDMSGKYENPNTYTFDLLGGAAKTDAPVAGGRTSEQKLTFWHLLSQININVSFGTDFTGADINGEVTGIRLGNVVSKAGYTISHNTNNSLNVACLPSAEANFKKSLAFSASPAIMNIIPQNVKSMDLYLDFTINKGLDDEASYRDLKINLNIPANDADYEPNGRYNWNITIGTGASITFNVTVTGWDSVGDIPEIEM